MANRILEAAIFNGGTKTAPIPLLNLTPRTLEVSVDDKIYIVVDGTNTGLTANDQLAVTFTAINDYINITNPSIPPLCP